MNKQNVHRTLRIAAFLAGSFVCFAPDAVFAGAGQSQQEASPTKPENQNVAAIPSQTPSTKLKKIWTEDDLIALRTPMDIYLLEKEAREAAEAAAAAALAAKEEDAKKAPKEAPLEINLPTTVEETQLLISNREQEIADEQSTIIRLKVELADAPEDQQAGKQKEIDDVSAKLEKAQLILKALQAQLEKLNAPQPETTPGPPSPPSS